jgi:hypothetical protein
MKQISDLCYNIKYALDEESDLYHIYTDKYYFMVPSNGLEHLKYGLEAHYTQNEYLLSCTDSELAELGKIKPKRTSLEEVNYQLERKSYNSKLIKANDLISRLPVFSQARNRNGKQHIADKRWKKALKDNNLNVMWLTNYYKYEEEYIKTVFPDIKWTRGSFAISPCHIYPAFTDRKEDSWTPNKIVRDLSIINKAFDKISSSPLNGKHAITKEDAQIAIDYLDLFHWDELSVTRQILYLVLSNRIANGFYNVDRFSDIALKI